MNSSKKNILIIDDSALMRRVLSDIINADDRFAVADMAVNGLDGLYMLTTNRHHYDAVLLDINMPKMNGIELLYELKKQNIKANIIIVSTLAKDDAEETILALEMGAFDFVSKPQSYLEIKGDLFADKIIDCLAAVTHLVEKSDGKTEEEKTSRKGMIRTRSYPLLQEEDANKIIALACSTGGPKALHNIIPTLPKNLDAAIVVVQHMPEGFTKSLALRLDELSEIHVKEAVDGELLEKGTVYIAKGGYQTRVIKTGINQHQLSVKKEAPRNGLLPCADVMYEALLDTDYEQIICVVLTGMGSDGTAGIRELDKNKNIYVIAQNEETSVVYGMPKVVKEAGLVDEEVALMEISNAIIKNVGVH